MNTALITVVTMLYIRTQFLFILLLRVCAFTWSIFTITRLILNQLLLSPTPPQMGSFSKICHWLNLPADSTPAPMPAPRPLTVVAEKHTTIFTASLGIYAAHVRGPVGLPGSPTTYSRRICSHIFKMTSSHFSPLASHHQHFSFSFQLFYLTEKIQAIWRSLSHTPFTPICPAARCSAGGTRSSPCSGPHPLAVIAQRPPALWPGHCVPA